MLFLTFFSTKAAVFYLFAHLSLVLFKNLNSFFIIFLSKTQTARFNGLTYACTHCVVVGY